MDPEQLAELTAAVKQTASDAVAAGLKDVNDVIDTLKGEVDGLKAAPATNNVGDLLDNAKGAPALTPLTDAGKAYQKRFEQLKRGDDHNGKGISLGIVSRAKGQVFRAMKDGRHINFKDLVAQTGDEGAISFAEAQEKALQADTFDAGGNLVPVDFSGEIIELLRDMTIVRQAGPRQVDMPRGGLNMGRQTDAASASYGEEGADTNADQLSTDEVNLVAKKLTGITPVSNDLLRTGGPSIDMLVRDDLLQVMSETEDLAFMRGNGTQSNPKGIRFQALAANITDRVSLGTTPNRAAIDTMALAMMGDLQDRNVRINRDRTVWMGSPRTIRYLMSITDNGIAPFKDELAEEGRFWGYRFFDTNALPINLSVSGQTDVGELMLVHMPDIVIGDTLTMDVSASTEASYLDATGTVRSAFVRDQTVIKAISEHDIIARHPESISVSQIRF